ncbi:MAG: hypothetical protein NW208_00170 [Bryobacter sp.]|nr:hypothetical protein [Bryobacter sp.]
MTNFIFTFAVTAALCIPTLSAQNIYQRESNQDARIRQGIRTGSLNAREAARLNALSNEALRDAQRDARDGGRFTYAERMEAQQEFNQVSRRISRAKAN